VTRLQNAHGINIEDKMHIGQDLVGLLNPVKNNIPAQNMAIRRQTCTAHQKGDWS
jgi:hypothetical protein